MKHLFFVITTPSSVSNWYVWPVLLIDFTVALIIHLFVWSDWTHTRSPGLYVSFVCITRISWSADVIDVLYIPSETPHSLCLQWAVTWMNLILGCAIGFFCWKTIHWEMAGPPVGYFSGHWIECWGEFFWIHLEDEVLDVFDSGFCMPIWFQVVWGWLFMFHPGVNSVWCELWSELRVPICSDRSGKSEHPEPLVCAMCVRTASVDNFDNFATNGYPL